MNDKSKVICEETGIAQDASETMLRIAAAHPPGIGMGALIMATSVAAREMNIPLERISALLNRTLCEVYAAAGMDEERKTLN